MCRVIARQNTGRHAEVADNVTRLPTPRRAMGWRDDGPELFPCVNAGSDAYRGTGRGAFPQEAREVRLVPLLPAARSPQRFVVRGKDW